MYYPDLSCYRDGGLDDVNTVYPAIKNIGWLGENHPYSKGQVPSEIVWKLREILFLDLKNSEDKKNGIYDDQNTINVHVMHVRGSPYHCPFCMSSGEVSISPDGVFCYSGAKEMVAGRNEVCLPSLAEGEFYSFPTMLYHYIVEHGYKPPNEFLSALAAFDVNKPYDVDSEQEDLDCVEVSPEEVNSFPL